MCFLRDNDSGLVSLRLVYSTFNYQFLISLIPIDFKYIVTNLFRVNTCPSCQTKFPICIVTGRPLMDLNSVWTCQTCHHRAYEQDITLKQNCPLCHASINE